MELCGISKSQSSVDYAMLEYCIREDLKLSRSRMMAVLDPIKLVIDNYPEGQVEELTVINNKKTGALLRAACMMGVAASSGHRVVEERCFEAARVYATNVGLAFQIRDDMLDVIGSAEEFGKPIGSDASNRKSTYVTLLGLEECERRVLAYTERAKEALRACKWQGSTEFLCTLADAMTERKK